MSKIDVSPPGATTPDTATGMVRPLDRRADVPLWQQLRRELSRRLRAGQFVEGFPAELDLVAQYGVSRHTVREALRQLRAEGIVSAGPGRRPRVVDAPVGRHAAGAIESLFAAVASAGLRHETLVRRLDTRADALVAVRLGLEESTPLVHLERVHLVDGEPLALDRVWLPASVGEPLLMTDFTRHDLYARLRTLGVTVTGGVENIRPVIPSAAEHRILGLTCPSAAFGIGRTGNSRDVPVEWRTTLVRGDRLNLAGPLGAPLFLAYRDAAAPRAPR